MKKLLRLFLPFVISGLFFFPLGLVLGAQNYFPEITEKLTQSSILGEQVQIFERNETPTKASLDRFWQVWELLEQKYLERPLDRDKMMYGAISGMVSSLGDPYTAFLPPSKNKEVKDALNGRYEGIGAELGMREDQLIIVAPLDGSPAQKAGIKAGDKIIKIDNEETKGINIMEAVSKIRGEAGTVVTLTLAREGRNDNFDVPITRDKIVLKSVVWEDKGEGIVYLKVSRFGEQANREWDVAVTEIIKAISQPSGVVLDLRSNPGGYFNSSIHIGSEFIREGLIVKEEFGDKTQKHFSVIRQGKLTSIPVVVLIDKGSASASEILAGALRDRRGAKLVGADSFGKGTVQDSHEFEDSSALHVTIAKWLTPAGVWVNEKGLSVDYQVEFADEDREAGRDPQLEKALEVLKTQI